MTLDMQFSCLIVGGARDLKDSSYDSATVEPQRAAIAVIQFFSICLVLLSKCRIKYFKTFKAMKKLPLLRAYAEKKIGFSGLPALRSPLAKLFMSDQ